jgi:hypothetical protein
MLKRILAAIALLRQAFLWALSIRRFFALYKTERAIEKFRTGDQRDLECAIATSMCKPKDAGSPGAVDSGSQDPNAKTDH